MSKIKRLIEFHSRFLSIIVIAIIWLYNCRVLIIEYGFDGSFTDVMEIIFGTTVFSIFFILALIGLFGLIGAILIVISVMSKIVFWKKIYISNKKVVIEYIKTIKGIINE